MKATIEEAVQAMGSGPLTEAGLAEHVWPLFSRVIAGCKTRGEIYLANHSLGRPLDQAALDVQHALDLWYERLDGAWGEGGWADQMQFFRSGISKLIGLSDPSCLIPKVSAGQGLRAVLNALPMDGSDRPIKVVSTRSEFDSLDFILKTYQQKGKVEVHWVEPTETVKQVPIFSSHSLIDAITEGVDLVVVSQVIFSTGQVMTDLEAIVAKAHSVGAMVLVDAYHAVGVVPVNMEEIGCDFMVGGSYKYTRGGPGGCWLAVHQRNLRTTLRTLDTGWFAKESPFAFERSEGAERAKNGNSWLESTPSILPFYQASAGIRLTLALGIDRIKAYRDGQIALLQSEFRRHGVEYFSDSRLEFGGFTLVPSPDASGLCTRLREAGVNTDARGSCVRFGPDLLNSSEELEIAAEKTRKAW